MLCISSSCCKRKLLKTCLSSPKREGQVEEDKDTANILQVNSFSLWYKNIMGRREKIKKQQIIFWLLVQKLQAFIFSGPKGRDLSQAPLCSGSYLPGLHQTSWPTQPKRPHTALGCKVYLFGVCMKTVNGLLRVGTPTAELGPHEFAKLKLKWDYNHEEICFRPLYLGMIDICTVIHTQCTQPQSLGISMCW